MNVDASEQAKDEATNAIRAALQALQRARELVEMAGYQGVGGPLLAAQRETQYVLRTVLDQN